MSDIKVLIAGTTRTGKTTISQLIKDALEIHGINVVVCDDGNFNEIHQFQCNRLTALREKEINVNIETIRSRRAGSESH